MRPSIGSSIGPSLGPSIGPYVEPHFPFVGLGKRGWGDERGGTHLDMQLNSRGFSPLPGLTFVASQLARPGTILIVVIQKMTIRDLAPDFA